MKLPQSFNFVPLLVVVLLVQDSRAEDTLREHTDWVLSVAFSPDGTTLASGAADTR
ncbi:MAG: WD40 repeat domain-containing protein [Gemmatimonadota bacterium]|nr:WD40 repeat domain-containing protein [Gemmatimonadota bacterium]